MMLQYHDTIWGVPLHDDRTLFEFLILDGAQAGLSWELILKTRRLDRNVFGVLIDVSRSYGLAESPLISSGLNRPR